MMNSIFVAEIVGTCILILLGNGVVANCLLKDTKGSGSELIIITTAWAFAVYAAVVIVGPYSGAHLNPAVTIGLAVSGLLEWHLVLEYIAGEMVGAMLGAFLVWIFYKNHFDRTEDENIKLACFSTSPAIKNIKNNFFSEAIATVILLLGVFFIAEPQLEHASLEGAKIGLGSIGALPIAIFVWGIGLSLGGTTGYAINPARDLGPRIVHSLLPFKGHSNWSYAWIPVVAPITGATIAALAYSILK